MVVNQKTGRLSLVLDMIDKIIIVNMQNFVVESLHRMVRICVREVGKFLLVRMYVAPPMRRGAWSMIRVLQQHIAYYY